LPPPLASKALPVKAVSPSFLQEAKPITKPAPAKLGDVFEADYGPLGCLKFKFA